MEILVTSFFWVTLGQIMIINIMLSGDNAVVIAMASRALPERQQKQAILFGSFGAIVLRVVLTFFAVMLLSLPFLKLVGGVLLVYIGIKMLIPDEAETQLDGHTRLWAAIKTIIVADFIMSLDNVLGVAAAAKGSLLLLIIGLGISIPLIIYGSTLILKLMNRFPFIITLGGGILGWVAGEMAVTDPALASWAGAEGRQWVHEVAPIAGALIVVAFGKMLAAAKFAKPVDVPMRAKELEDAPAPAGFRWMHRAWRMLPDGTRDYAAYYGKTAFRYLVPTSGRVREPRRTAGHR
ncbi:MAG: TerC family protein [Burkholderiales bacterium]|nr:TerC family protein [Burkholderiales bacterium]